MELPGICLFEDSGVVDLEPLTLTRPAFDLLCGTTTLGEKQCRFGRLDPVSALVRPHLVDTVHLSHPARKTNSNSCAASGPTLFINSRWLPPAEAIKIPEEPCVGLHDGEIVFARVAAQQAAAVTWETLEDSLDLWKRTLPHHEAGGRLIRYLWDLVNVNGDEIENDFAGQYAGAGSTIPEGFAVVGSRERLFVHPESQIDPLVVADTRAGAVIVSAGAVIGAFTQLEGPCFIGPGTHALGAKIRAGTSLGPNCRIGGEVECSIVQGHSNKYHDGFLGHAYVGEWVNLGAGTSNSDLRNDYGPVTMTVNGRRVSTGLKKVGCFLGDHTKAGLGTLLNTGTNIGAFCNLLPSGGLLPKYIPSFGGWWNGALTENADLDGLLRTAATVMDRRGATLTEAHEHLYRHLYRQTGAERCLALYEAETRRLRRSA
jgi:UDP-N-acetylglucosamine diphosphorylase / glucose-1-phosphate thymidylyltransferase / UDP-N-acetylgalactosamine diphosphorylase / glucosamine-1-phosphate N-acetyltransferase / galactosamine-1-phosphate N-acetyltransferase